jgi:hypothetical protein
MRASFRADPSSFIEPDPDIMEDDDDENDAVEEKVETKSEPVR